MLLLTYDNYCRAMKSRLGFAGALHRAKGQMLLLTYDNDCRAMKSRLRICMDVAAARYVSPFCAEPRL